MVLIYNTIQYVEKVYHVGVSVMALDKWILMALAFVSSHLCNFTIAYSFENLLVSVMNCNQSLIFLMTVEWYFLHNILSTCHTWGRDFSLMSVMYCNVLFIAKVSQYNGHNFTIVCDAKCRLLSLWHFVLFWLVSIVN